MTPRPPPQPAEALSDEERELAERLSRLDAGAGPSSALDARILAAARSATTSPVRRDRRWPGALGAAAVLVAAVGMAWQLRPMFELPPPMAEHAENAGNSGRAGAESETVVQIQNIPRAPAPVATIGDQAASVAASAAARKAPPVAAGRNRPALARAAVSAPRQAAAPRRSPEFVDEAMPAGDVPSPAVAAAPAADKASSPGFAQAEAKAAVAAPRRTATGVDDDARLSAREWLARIRERRDAGDLTGARASLARFVVAHPRLRIPRDLRTLIRDDDPWAP